MPTVRRYTQADVDKLVAESEQRGYDKARARLDPEQQPERMTLEKIQAGEYSDDELIERKSEVDALLKEAGVE